MWVQSCAKGSHMLCPYSCCGFSACFVCLFCLLSCLQSQILGWCLDSGLGWRQDNGNRSNQESKFDFLDSLHEGRLLFGDNYKNARTYKLHQRVFPKNKTGRRLNTRPKNRITSPNLYVLVFLQTSACPFVIAPE